MQRRPNLLFIFSDQHAAKATGCYGNRVADTPNLHRLAGEGVTFDNAYCPPSHMRRCAGDWSRKCYATGTRWRWGGDPSHGFWSKELVQRALFGGVNKLGNPGFLACSGGISLSATPSSEAIDFVRQASRARRLPT